MAGLSDQGFSVKRLNDIISELKTNAETEFASLVSGEDIVNTSDTSVLGRWIKTVSAPIADLWQAAQDVYASFDLYQASGDALENLTILGGVSRSPATASSVYLLAYGDISTVIPADSFVKSGSTGKVFATDSSLTLDVTNAQAIRITPTAVSNSTTYSFTFKVVNIDTSATTVSITSDASATTAEIVNAIIAEVNSTHGAVLTATLESSQALITLNDNSQRCLFTAGDFTISKVKKFVTATCTESGPNAQPIDSIQNIQSPVIGWDSVTNPIEATVGTNVETDDELRARYVVAKFTDSSNTYESIYAAVRKIQGVQQVGVYENDTDNTWDTPAVPPHSIYVLVFGGDEDLIANAIWMNKAAGIGTYGGVTKSVTDSNGIAHTINFDRPSDLTIYVDVEVQKLSNYPLDGDDQIAAALAGSLPIGQDVIYSRLFTPINSVPGHYVNHLYIGTSASPTSTSNISVAFNQRAVFNVTVRSV